MEDTEFRKQSSLRDNIASLIVSFVCVIAFLVIHQINVFSSQYGLAFNITEHNVGIYFTKLNSLRNLLMMLGVILEYIIYKTTVKICVYTSSVTFSLMILMRLTLLILLYSSSNLPLHSYIIFNAEALFFGAFQNTLFRLTPQYSRTTSLSIQISGLLAFLIQCICDCFSYNIPILNVKIQYCVSLLTSILGLGLWIFYLFYFDYYFPWSIDESSYKIDKNSILKNIEFIGEINELTLISEEVENKENELKTLIEMNVPKELIQKQKLNNYDIFNNLLKILSELKFFKEELKELESKIISISNLKEFIEEFSKFDANEFLNEIKKALKEIKGLNTNQIKGTKKSDLADIHQLKTRKISEIKYNYFNNNFSKKFNSQKINELIIELDKLSKELFSQAKILYKNNNEFMEIKSRKIIPCIEKINNLMPEILEELKDILASETKKLAKKFEESDKIEKVLTQMKNIIEILKKSINLEITNDLTNKLLNILELLSEYCNDEFLKKDEYKLKIELINVKNNPFLLKTMSNELINKLRNMISLNKNIYDATNFQNQLSGFNKGSLDASYIIISGIRNEELIRIEKKAFERFKLSNLIIEIKNLLNECKEFNYQDSPSREQTKAINASFNLKNNIYSITISNEIFTIKQQMIQLNNDFKEFSSLLLTQGYNIKDKKKELYSQKKFEISQKSETIIKILNEIEEKINELKNEDNLKQIDELSTKLQTSFEQLRDTIESYILYKNREKERHNTTLIEKKVNSDQKSIRDGIEKFKKIVEKLNQEKEEIEKSKQQMDSKLNSYYKSLMKYQLELLSEDIETKIKRKSEDEKKIRDKKDEINAKIEKIKQKLNKMNYSNHFINCLSPFMMVIAASAIKDFLHPGILPYAFLERDKCHFTNKSSALIFTFGSLTVYGLDKYLIGFKEWDPLMNLFWLLLVPQIDILFFSILGIHTKISLFHSMVGCKVLVLLMTVALLYCYSLMESMSYVGVANYVVYKSDNILETLPILTYLNIVVMFCHYLFAKLSVGYNTIRVQYGLILPDFNPIEIKKDYTFSFWLSQSIKNSFRDIFLDFKLNIRDYT